MYEYARVLAYPKFKLTEREISALLGEDILPFILPVKVASVLAVVKADPSDDKFLACAKSGKAHALVSGDSHLLALKTYDSMPILDVRGFLERAR